MAEAIFPQEVLRPACASSPPRAVPVDGGPRSGLLVDEAVGAAADAGTYGGLKLAQVANFLSPTSGGLRVVVEQIGARRNGIGSRLLVIPGPVTRNGNEGSSRTCCVASPRLPGEGHDYHVLLRRRRVADELRSFAPDLVEVHDQTTLAWAARWARRAGVPSVLFSHERLDLVAGEVSGAPQTLLEAVGRRWARHLAGRFDAVVCHSEFAAVPFAGADQDRIHRIPLGVDLERFVPCAPPLPSAQRGRARLVFVGRLYREKAPEVALDILEGLGSIGLDVELIVIGDGPLGPSLRERTRRNGLPVTFLGHVADRSAVAHYVARSDVALSPGPRETFGLGALEAMACGTPVLVSSHGACRELLAPGAGACAADTVSAVRAVRHWLTDPQAHERARAAARRRAEEFGWERTSAALARLREELVGGVQAPRRISRRRSPPAR